MGVLNFGRLIRTANENLLKHKKVRKQNQIMIERDFSEYKNTVCAVDAMLLWNRFVIAILGSTSGESFHTSTGKETSHIYAFFFKMLSLLNYAIMPVCVFDGKAPELKRKTLEKRRNIKVMAQQRLDQMDEEGVYDEEEEVKLKKKTVYIDSTKIRDVQYLLTIMGLPYVRSVGEADSQCAAMYKAGVVNGVVTEDWDTVIFGATIWKDFSNKKKVIEVNLKALLDELELTQEQLVDIAIILGTDYCPGIKGIGPQTVIDDYKKAGCDMVKLIELLNDKNKAYGNAKYEIPDDFVEKWRDVKEYYLRAKVIDPKSIETAWNEPNYIALREFLLENEFNEELVDVKIGQLRMLFNAYNKDKNMSTLTKLKFQNGGFKYNNNSCNTENFVLSNGIDIEIKEPRHLDKNNINKLCEMYFGKNRGVFDKLICNTSIFK